MFELLGRRARARTFVRLAVASVVAMAIVVAGIVPAGAASAKKPKPPKQPAPTSPAVGTDTCGAPYTLPAWSDAAGWSEPGKYRTIQWGDFIKNAQNPGLELIGRSAAGLEIWTWDATLGRWMPPKAPNGRYLSVQPARPILTDAADWDVPWHSESIMGADIDGDGQEEVIARASGGIIAYKWEAVPSPGPLGETTYTPTFVPMSNGPQWADANGWTQPEYYKTLQFANVDNRPGEELIARSASNGIKGGIETWTYDATTSSWRPLSESGMFSDAAGWNKVQYYSTIHTGDFDGDGRAELFGRAIDGLFAYKFSLTTHQWEEMPRPDVVSGLQDALHWDQPQYYSTIQAARVTNMDRDDIVARGPDGLRVMSFNGTSWGMVLPKGNGVLTDAAGWGSNPAYYGTIQAAFAIAHQPEMVFARGAGGMVVLRFVNGKFIPWTGATPPLSDQCGWDANQDWETIQAVDLDRNGRAEIIGRDSAGMRAFTPVGSQPWASDKDPGDIKYVDASASFPSFDTKEDDIALEYIDEKLGIGGSETFRTIYKTETASQLSDRRRDMDELHQQLPPPGVSSATWQSITSQLSSELGSAQSVSDYATSAATELNATIIDHSLSLDVVGDLVGVAADDPVNAFFERLTSTFIESAVYAVAEESGIGTMATEMISGIVGDSLDDVMGSHLEEHVSMTRTEVSSQLRTNFTQAYNQLDKMHNDVASDYGLLSAFAAIRKADFYAKDLSGAARAASQRAFDLWLWQTLTPTVWKVDNFSQTLVRFGWPHSDVRATEPTLFDHVMGAVDAPATCTTSFVYTVEDGHIAPNGCGLGQTVADIAANRNGWHLGMNMVSVSDQPAAALAPPDAAMMATLLDDLYEATNGFGRGAALARASAQVRDAVTAEHWSLACRNIDHLDRLVASLTGKQLRAAHAQYLRNEVIRDFRDALRCGDRAEARPATGGAGQGGTRAT